GVIKQRVGAGGEAARVGEIECDGAGGRAGEGAAGDGNQIADGAELEVENGPCIEREAVGEGKRAGRAAWGERGAGTNGGQAGDGAAAAEGLRRAEGETTGDGGDIEGRAAADCDHRGVERGIGA